MSEPALKLVDTHTGELSSGSDSALMARIEELEHDLANVERELRQRRAQITRLQRDKERERQAFEQRDVVERLFAFWQKRCKHPKSRLTPERFDAARACLEHGYDEEQMRLAILGAAFQPFTKPRKNGTVERFDDLELIFRNGSNLERFACRAPRGST